MTPDRSAVQAESRRGPAAPWIVLTAALFALVTVLGLAWPLGGLEEAERDIPEARFGETTTGQRFSIKPLAASYVTKDPMARYGDPEPGRFLTIEFEVRNVSDQTATTEDLAQRLHIRCSPGGRLLDRFKDRHGGYVIRDESSGRRQIQPGLTERVMIAYTVPDGMPDPTHVRLGFEDQVYSGGFFSDLPEWRPGEFLAAYEADVKPQAGS